MLITNLILFYLLLFNLFQKLNIFLSFTELQIWVTQLPYCEANFTNLNITIWEKTALSSSSVEVGMMNTKWKMNTIYSDCRIHKRNNSNGKKYLLNFLSVIEDIHVLLIIGLSYSFTSFFYRYYTFLWFILYILSLTLYLTVRCNGLFMNKRILILTAKRFLHKYKVDLLEF